jgi:uncharacterized protein (TIRG00374 family)
MRPDRRQGGKKVLSAVWRSIGPLALLAALLYVGPAGVLDVLHLADPLPLVGAIVLAGPQVFVRGIRWHLVLRGFRLKSALRESIGLYSFGMTLATVTPGRIGDFVKIIPLCRRDDPVATAISASVFDRLVDVVFIVFVGYVSMWYFSKLFIEQIRVMNLVAVILAGLGVFVVVLRRRLLPVVSKLLPSRIRSAMRRSREDIVNGVGGKNVGEVVTVAVLTAVAWGLHFTAIWLCSVALKLDIPFIFLSGCVVLTSLSAFLPITVAGAGTRDAIFLVMLGQIGVSQPQSIAMSSVVLVLFLVNCVSFYLIAVALGVTRLFRVHGDETVLRQAQRLMMEERSGSAPHDP